LQLLGQYQNNLTTAYYSELLALITSAISTGDLAGGSAFDQSNLLALEAEAQSFESLPIGTNNSTVTDDSINYPLSLLQARLNAILSEVNSFISTSDRLLNILVNETTLIDKLLSADKLNYWVTTLPKVLNAWSASWDFTIGLGAEATYLSPIDPEILTSYEANSAALVSYVSNIIGQNIPTSLAQYVFARTGTTSEILNALCLVNGSEPSECNTGRIFDCSSSTMLEGLLPSNNMVSFPIKNIVWNYETNGTPQELYAQDFTWAQLDIIEDEPNITFINTPSVQTIFPQGSSSAVVINVTGQVPGGALPTYLRLLFYPRSNVKTTSIVNGTTTPLSAYSIDPNNISIISLDGSIDYSLTTDFNVDPIKGITPINISTLTEVIIYFTEYWPAYQCSLDQTNWSPIVMLDPNRIYPDDTVSFTPVDVDITNNIFPITDETGLSTGLYFQLMGILNSTYTFLITTPSIGEAVGPVAVMELEVLNPSYMNTLQISPYSESPMLLTQVQIVGLTQENISSVFIGSLLLDSSIQIQFPRQFVCKIYLTLTQNNYTIKEYQDVSSNSLRENIMNSLQASMPVAVQTANVSTPVVYRGYQYEWGIEDLAAYDLQQNTPSVFVQGPFTIQGCPILIRFDAQVYGTINSYICYQAYSSTGALLDENLLGFSVTPGSSIVFPFSSGVTISNISYVVISLRFVLRSINSGIYKYNLQVTA
jgi:hypothetical protein